ncbi:MAG: hypothetical protein R2878_11280 [Thermoleophilia bacterium]
MSTQRSVKCVERVSDPVTRSAVSRSCTKRMPRSWTSSPILGGTAAGSTWVMVIESTRGPRTTNR